MSEDRVEQFKQEMESMQVRDPSQGRDRLWLRVSVGLMVVGLIVAVAAYPLAATGNSLEQGQAIVQAIAGLTAAVVGAVLLVATLSPAAPSVRRGRLGDVLESVALLTLLPLLVVATGLFDQVRDWIG